MTSVVVIGGGMIGLSVAWRAAQRGLAVTVADPSPGQGASRAAAGLLIPVARAEHAEQAVISLGLESLARYPDFCRELTALTGKPTGFSQAGTLQVGYDSADLAALGELSRLHEATGRPLRQLDAGECAALEPMLNPSVRGGLLVEGDGSVDPRLLHPALLAAAHRAGVRLISQPAADVVSAQGRARGALLADGTLLQADWVVLAAGWNSSGIGGLPPGALPPVRPVKGQTLRLRAAAGRPLLRRPVHGVAGGSSLYLVPRADGELVIGATQEESGPGQRPDLRATAGAVWELLRLARLLVPGIDALEFAEVSAGLRPAAPDNAPVLGPCGLPGLLLATGHFRQGVLLAPVTADIIADYLATQRLPDLAAPLALSRFET